MKNKRGYTIIEAVIAMFLVVVMVGSVFSALMSGRRAIVSSSEKEEVLYTAQSAYKLIKNCRQNETNCILKQLGCDIDFSSSGSEQNLTECSALFTHNFKNICKEGGTFTYELSDASPSQAGSFYGLNNNFSGVTSENLPTGLFYTLDVQLSCDK